MTDEIRSVHPLSPEALQVLTDLGQEYDRRYGDVAGRKGAASEINRYPAAAFEAPHGDFLVLVHEGQILAGGAFMPHDDETAEIKRVWTRGDLRRQGHSRRIMAALERRAAELGYSRLYLTTGFRQPEAVGLYLALGYRPLFEVTEDPAHYRSLPFEKHIGIKAGQPGQAPKRRLAHNLAEASADVAALKARHDSWLARHLGLG